MQLRRVLDLMLAQSNDSISAFVRSACQRTPVFSKRKQGFFGSLSRCLLHLFLLEYAIAIEAAAARRECSSFTRRRSSATPGPKHLSSAKIRTDSTGLNVRSMVVSYHRRAVFVKLFRPIGAVLQKRAGCHSAAFHLVSLRGRDAAAAILKLRTRHPGAKHRKCLAMIYSRRLHDIC